MSDPIDPPATGERSAPERDAERRKAGADPTKPSADRPSPTTSDGSTPDLRLAIVEYENEPDRGTIHPPHVTGVDRMETWISVDMELVVDVSAWR